MIKDAPQNHDLYAIIDLGSNSFHLMVARYLNGELSPLARVRRKVQLASGLDDGFFLDEKSIKRGLDCLEIFADRVKHFEPSRVKAVATATLRLAQNRDDFIQKAQKILGHTINIIDGKEEARLIFLGAKSTLHDSQKTLVIDIGGASTELIIGFNDEIKYLTSLSIGCVTWRKRFFQDDVISSEKFDLAISQAKLVFKSEFDNIKIYAWDSVLSACGTVQTLNEILIAQKLGSSITLDILYEIKQQLLNFKDIKAINIKGLFHEKVLVFPSGLSILIALFEVFDIQNLIPTDGALREGLLSSFMQEKLNHNKTHHLVINQIQNFYQIDTKQATRVRQQLFKLIESLKPTLNLTERIIQLLCYCSELHELGLAVNLKNANNHSSYLINHLSHIGLSIHEKGLLNLWIQVLSPQKIKAGQFSKQSILPKNKALILSILLKLAVISCIHRMDEFIAPISVKLESKNDKSQNEILSQKMALNENSLKEYELNLLIDRDYLLTHPLIKIYLLELIDEVRQEIRIKLKYK